MKNSVCGAVFVMCVMSMAGPAEAAVKVFLLAGQSNMEGAGDVSQLTPPYSSPQPSVRFWDAVSGKWTDLRPGVGRTIPEFGPEVSFGYALHNAFPGDSIYLVKYAIGGTNLAADWNPNGGGYCYNNFKTAANAALDNLRNAGLSPTVAGTIWMQGETDTIRHNHAVAYGDNLSNLISKARTDFATPQMPFVLGQITTYLWQGQVTVADNQLVRTAQSTVPGQVGNASWINTDDLQICTTNPGHYGTQGQIDLGIRFAAEFIETPEPSLPVLTGSGLLILAGHLSRQRRLARKQLRGEFQSGA